jgi:hypothetical protein
MRRSVLLRRSVGRQFCYAVKSVRLLRRAVMSVLSSNEFNASIVHVECEWGNKVFRSPKQVLL